MANVEERLVFGPAFEEDVQALVGTWRAGQDRLVQLARDPVLLATTDAGLAASRIQSLNREVDTVLSGLEASSIRWASGTVPTYVDIGTGAAIESAVTQGLEAAALGAFGIVNTQSMEIIVQNIIDDVDYSTNSIRRNMRRHFRATQQALVQEAAINLSILESEALLEAAPARAARLEALFAKHAGTGALINVNGRFFQLSTYSDIIARTRLTEATVEAALRATMSMGLDLVKVTDHGKTDKFCDPFAGKVFSISGTHTKFPRLTKRPPFHPRCRHGLLPFVEALKSDRELEFFVARSRGRIEAGVSFEEFFSAVA